MARDIKNRVDLQRSLREQLQALSLMLKGIKCWNEGHYLIVVHTLETRERIMRLKEERRL